MQVRKSLYIITFIFSALILSSCSKCPICGSYFGSNNTHAKSLRISDVRIGTGETDITIGTIVFNTDEKIIITLDVKNLTTLSENGLNYYWIREDLVVRDKNGGMVLLKPAIIDGKEPIYSKPLKFKNMFTLSHIEGIKPGNYTVSILVTDLIKFQTATTTIPIKVK